MYSLHSTGVHVYEILTRESSTKCHNPFLLRIWTLLMQLDAASPPSASPLPLPRSDISPRSGIYLLSPAPEEEPELFILFDGFVSCSAVFAILDELLPLPLLLIEPASVLFEICSDPYADAGFLH
jgi:hypothetical protein